MGGSPAGLNEVIPSKSRATTGGITGIFMVMIGAINRLSQAGWSFAKLPPNLFTGGRYFVSV